ncbi:hypothetical protein EW145_g2183 [Phellinidium pouzarii]|uniref:Cytochrome P450 n=1 Tax=Phellinidium pouzarii TaxID=167371 RepID=A0A4S4LC42_9AGAM|nr:hypothetical protein EW145_g2183 [Phellinidium pouzarii]
MVTSLKHSWILAQFISPIYVLSTSFAILLFYCVTIAVYRIFFSPLRAVPGPWYATVSELWITTHTLRLRRCRAIDELLSKYGEIVRIAPNKIVFCDSQTMRSVYGISSRLDKSSFYKCLSTNENDHAMTTLEHSPHHARKKGYAPYYSFANLKLFQPEIHDISIEMVNILTSAASHNLTSFDTLLLLRHLMIDINCLHLFGYNVSSLKAWSRHIVDAGISDPLSDAISDFPKRGLIKSTLPAWLWGLVQHIPNRRWKKFCDSDARLGKFVTDRVQEMRELIHSGKVHVDGKEKKSLIMRLLFHKYSETEAMPDKDIISEGVGHLIAGSDTTSTTLSYLLWELSRRHDIMLRLQAELNECMYDCLHIPDLKILQDLPYLNAVIKEGLRVYTAAPSPLERVVPASENKFSLLGHAMPAGTIISSQAWSSHRQRGIFFCPDMFIPDRWLLMHPSPPQTAFKHQNSIPVINLENDNVTANHNNSASQAQMAANMFSFGHGTRVCGGQNMALMMLRIVLAVMVRNFDIVASPGTDERSMEIKDSFLIRQT